MLSRLLGGNASHMLPSLLTTPASAAMVSSHEGDDTKDGESDDNRARQANARDHPDRSPRPRQRLCDGLSLVASVACAGRVTAVRGTTVLGPFDTNRAAPEESRGGPINNSAS